MKRLTILLITIFMAISMSLSAYAGNHDRGKHHDRKEYRHEKKSHKTEKHHNVKRPHVPHRAPHRDKHDRWCHDRLKDMVSHATRGCHSVNVWRISDDTFVVKYNRGGKWYMQRLYPGNGRYGSPIRIIIDRNGEWYPYSDHGQRYIPEGDRLQLIINGVAQAVWQLLPAFM